MISSVFDSEFIARGGPAQYALLAISIPTTGLLLERVWFWCQWAVQRWRHPAGAVGEALGKDGGELWFLYVRPVAPLLGILGTVHGIIRAFARMGASRHIDFEGLASDVAMALYTTAFGLVIAILCTAGLALNELGTKCECTDEHI